MIINGHAKPREPFTPPAWLLWAFALPFVGLLTLAVYGIACLMGGCG